MSKMKELDIERLNKMYPIGHPAIAQAKDLLEGPLSMSEADLAALEERHRGMVSGCIRIRGHLCNCQHSDQKTLDAFDDLLKYIGLHDEVVGPQEPITQPKDY